MAGSIRAVLTDIEGTTTAVRFVTETLFPYARARIPGHVRAHHADPAFAELFAAVRAEAGIPRDQGGPEALINTLLGWMDEDRKAGPLKTLQGLIWEDGYRDGTLVSHLYPDVAPALRAWRARGLRLAVYSSGSVAAQRLLFGHTSEGDLCPLFSAYFDTGSGPKREVQSYHNIRAALGVEPAGILFLSDVVAELDAARAAGLPTRWLVREGPLPTKASHTAVSGFDQISID